MTFSPILTISNFKEPYELEKNVVGSCVGAALSQNNHPIPYFSKKLSL